MSLAPLLPDETVPPFVVAVDITAGRVTVSGELDHCSAHLLTDALAVLELSGARVWTLDAAGVTFCDGGGVTALLAVRRAAAGRGRDLYLVRTSHCIRRLVALVGLDDVLSVSTPAAPMSLVRVPLQRHGAPPVAG